MSFKNIEEFEHEVDVQKTVLGSMPVNNQKNLSVYKEKVAEIKEEYSAYKEKLFNEIEKAIEGHGGTIKLYDTLDLQLARKE